MDPDAVKNCKDKAFKMLAVEQELKSSNYITKDQDNKSEFHAHTEKKQKEIHQDPSSSLFR